MTKNIVIVGAGYAGVEAAMRLGKKFKHDSSVNITLIDRNSYLTYMTELHEVAGGRIEPDGIKYDLQRLFHRRKNVKLVTDNIKNFDYENKVVEGEHGNYSYDYLLIGVGGEANDFGVDGVKDHAFKLWSASEAEAVREHIIDTVYAAAREHDETKRRALLSYVVAGAGFTGVEMIGELFEWLPILLKEHKLDINEVSYHLVEAAPKILNTVTEKEQERAIRYMEKQGVNITLGDGIVKVKKDSIDLASGKEIPTHTCIWTAGVKAKSEVEDWDLDTARQGRIVVNQFMEVENHEGVYAIGDAAYYEDPHFDNQPIPMIVQAAELTGEVAADNVIAEITGSDNRAYKGKYDGNMVSIGSRYGVAYLYDKYSVHGFVSNVVKHGANIKYFLSLGSFYYAWMYVREEFFTIKNKRNMMGGLFSAYGNMLWLVPLRVYYGAMWLIEGLKKTFGLFGGSSWFGDNVVFPFEWLVDTTTGATDAVSGATDAVEAVGEAVFSLNYVYGEEPMLVLEKMPNWFAKIMEFMMPNQDVALFMQKFMSVFEIVIGLLLIVGLFTWLVSAGTVVLVGMFVLSGMFVWVNIWFVPVAIALMAGAGKTLGLDYYVMPWLGNLLDRWIWGEPRAIYKEI